MQRYQRTGHKASPHVVRLERKRDVATGTRPMSDVFVAAPLDTRPALVASIPASERFIASFLVLLMVLLPLSPVIAAEELDGAALSSEIENILADIPADSPDSTVATENDTETNIVDVEPVEESGEEVTDNGEDSSIPDVTSTSTATTNADGDSTDASTIDADISENDAVTEFNPNELPSEDNPAPDDWYESDGVGEEITTGENQGNETSSDTDTSADVNTDTGNEGDTDIAAISEDDTDEKYLNAPKGSIEELLYVEGIDDDVVDDLRLRIRKEIEADFVDQRAQLEEKRRKMEDSCLKYEDGSFFCLNPDEESVATSPDEGRSGTVYAQVDPSPNETDYEIYFLGTNEIDPIRLTDDKYHNQFPAIDVNGDAVVWQAQINDRWQIKYLSLKDGSGAEQLTSSLYNSVNPAIFGNLVVWQSWIQNNWEIVLARRADDGSWSVEQLTKNAYHDILPKVAGGFVTWQSRNGDEWQVWAYDLAQGTAAQLSAGADKYENPRIALIWEAQQADGSREIISFDLSTGEVEPIGSRPATPSPDTLPKPPLTDEEITVEVKPAGRREGAATDNGEPTPDN